MKAHLKAAIGTIASLLIVVFAVKYPITIMFWGGVIIYFYLYAGFEDEE